MHGENVGVGDLSFEKNEGHVLNVELLCAADGMVGSDISSICMQKGLIGPMECWTYLLLTLR